MTTTGTHVLPCPTCGGFGESPSEPEDNSNVVVLQHSELKESAAKPVADDL